MQTLNLNNDLIKSWLVNNTTYNDAVLDLEKNGITEPLLTNYLEEFKKQRRSRRQTNGLVLMGIGAFIGFISCVFTMLDIAPDFRGVLLYGITTLGVSIAFWGMYLLFEG